jgi:prevent-host-death family protein
MTIKRDHICSVGIKELKAKLSSYLERVRNGEQIIVTDHGEEVALLVSISRERRVIKSLVGSGLAQWAGGKPRGFEGAPLKGKSLAETILEERQ